MYTKEELESMDIPQLVGIADELGIKVSPDDQLETVVYAILDKAAENSASADDAPKRNVLVSLKKIQAEFIQLTARKVATSTQSQTAHVRRLRHHHSLPICQQMLLPRSLHLHPLPKRLSLKSADARPRPRSSGQLWLTR